MEKVPKLINSLFWSFIDLMSRQGLLLITQIILTRLLLPEHFGLIGMTAIFIAIATTLTNSGLDQALIREKHLTNTDYSVVFTFNLLLSLFLYLLFYLVAPLIALFYGEPEISNVLRVLMLIIVINAFSLVQRVILIRNMQFKKQTIVSILSSFISGSIAILIAMYGGGVWSLVIQQLLYKTIETLSYMLINKQKIAFRVDFKILNKYFSFGYRLTLSGLLSNTFNNIYFLIIGRTHSVQSLGYYTNASKLRDSISQSFTSAIQKVTYPALSKKQDNIEILSNNYKKLIKMTAFIFFPIMVGFSAIAPTLIPFILGQRWDNAVLYFQLLCIAGMFYPVHALNLNILKVMNRSELFLRIELIKITIISFFILVALIIDGSISSLITASILGTLASLVINIIYSSQIINYSFYEQVKNLLPAILLSFVTFFIVSIFNSYLDFSTILNLITQIIIGITVYIILCVLFKIDELYISFSMIKKLIRKN